MRGALPNPEATMLLLGHVAMNRKSYLRKVPKLHYETSKFAWQEEKEERKKMEYLCLTESKLYTLFGILHFMKKIAFTYLILFLFSLNVLAQNTDKNNFSLGLFIGEGTGVLTDFSINDKFGIEWNISYNEIFYKYRYTNKYSDFINQKYNNIYSSSLLLNYRNKFTGTNKLKYHFAIGNQIRLITDYYQGIPVSAPPNTIIIDDPTTKNKIDIGISSLMGAEYCLTENISIFFDLGAYIELTDVFLWSNLQFRTGLMYRINFKRKE